MFHRHSLHRERMGDANHLNRIGPLASKRPSHLDKLKTVEALVHEKAPLPASYDVNRSQPPYFFEFTYTECLGLLYVAPQSCELAARVMASAADADDEIGPFNVADHLPCRDKYDLADPTDQRFGAVCFPPGSNLFELAVSREALERAMERDPQLVIKLHPLTHASLATRLGTAFGYHRIIAPEASGYGVLKNCSTVYTTTSSEMGLYAILQGKPIQNVTAHTYEFMGVFNPIYRLLWDLPGADAKRVLIKLLNSPLSGLFHPDDPDLARKMDAYFENVMRLREPFKPLVREYDPAAYGRFINPHYRKAPNALGKDQPKQ